MSELRNIEGEGRVTNARFAILATRFNDAIVGRLVDGAVDRLRRQGVEAADLHVVRVPGAWELPLAADRLAASGNYDGLVALGCVIRGETAHFDYVCDTANRGLDEVSRRHALPLGFGVLTVENRSQAEARAGGAKGNQGEDAAAAAAEMVNLLRRIKA